MSKINEEVIVMTFDAHNKHERKK